MTEITVRVPEQDLDRFLAWLSEHGYEHEEASHAVPAWQQEEVLKRAAQNGPNDYHSWEEVRARVFGTYKGA